METRIIVNLSIELLLIMLCFDSCQSYQHGVYLDSDTYKQLDNIGIKQCAKRCYAEPECKSINFSKSRFTCNFNNYNTNHKPLVSHSDYIYEERSNMAKNFPDFFECPNEHVLLKMHDGRNFCHKIQKPPCNSRLMWQSNPEVTITVSGTHEFCSLDRASLNYTDTVTTGHAWCAGTKNMPDEYIQIEFNTTYEIQSIMTQGRRDAGQWLKSYRINTSDDGVTWTQIGGDLSGNTDRNTVVTNKLPGNVKTSYLRIIPVTFQTYPSCRFDLIACRV